MSKWEGPHDKECWQKHHLFMHPLPIIHPTVHRPWTQVSMNPSIHHPGICASSHSLSTHPSSRHPFARPSFHPSVHSSIIQRVVHPIIHSLVSVNSSLSIPPSSQPAIHLSTISICGGRSEEPAGSPSDQELVAPNARSAGVMAPFTISSFRDGLSYRELPPPVTALPKAAHIH